MAGPARLKTALHAAIPLVGAAPLAWLALRVARDDLGANPVEEISHFTGAWALRLLVLCLAVTPLRRVIGWSWLAPQRRSLGLLAFAWACLHVGVYAIFDLGLDAAALAEELGERPYLAAGFTAWICLVPLAATSTRGAVRRLGPRWRRLHRLVYVAAAAAVVHFLWLVKLDLREPLVYAAVVGLLLGLRLYWWLGHGKGRSSMRRSRPARAGAGADPRGRE
jgi:sulfoxide reductase heme-binding subunit YedZ